MNAKEQEGMRKVCRLAREVLDIAARELRPGVTTDYIDQVVHKACVERNVRQLFETTRVPILIGMRSRTHRRSIM